MADLILITALFLCVLFLCVVLFWMLSELGDKLCDTSPYVCKPFGGIFGQCLLSGPVFCSKSAKLLILLVKNAG